MINLLPPERKKELFDNHLKKLILVFGWVAIISFVCLILILFAVKFRLMSELVFQRSVLFQSVPANIDYSPTIKKYNLLMPRIVDHYEGRGNFEQVLEVILINEKLNFSEISLSRQEGKIKISLSGTSETRENLLSFENGLADNKKISEIQFSPNSWINDKNSFFNLSFQFLNEIK